MSWFYLLFSSVSAFTCCVPFPPPISHIRFFLRSGNNTYPPRTVWYPLEYRTAIRCPGCVCTNPRPCQGTARDRFTDGVPSAAASYRSQLDGLRLCCGLPRPGGQSRRQQRWPPGLVPLRDRDDAAYVPNIVRPVRPYSDDVAHSAHRRGGRNATTRAAAATSSDSPRTP